MQITIKDATNFLTGALDSAVKAALDTCGAMGEALAEAQVPVDTGHLKGNISHQTEGHSVYVGTNVDYGKYVELGTGIYAENGRKTPWVYRAKDGTWHRTQGSPAQPYLKPALEDHQEALRQVLVEKLGG